MLTREVLAGRLRDYLQCPITRIALVDWAERAMMDEEFDRHACFASVEISRTYAQLHAAT